MRLESLKSCKQQEALVMFFDENQKALSPWPDPVVKDYLKIPLSQDFKGRFKESLLLYLPGHPVAKRLLLVGLGKLSDLSLQKVRVAGGQAAMQLSQRSVSAPSSFLVPRIGKFKVEEIVEALTIGCRVAQLNYNEWKSQGDGDKKANSKLLELGFVSAESSRSSKAAQSIERGKIIADGVNFGRRLIAMSPRQLNPIELARQAAEVARKSPSKSKIKAQIWTEKELKKNAYGGILCVAQGSDNPPRFVQLEYRNAAASKKPVILVGKGVTFDSGGLSLKPPSGQETMKYDMAGAGSVLAAFKIATDLKLKINLVCLIPCVENMPSGKAQRPGDVVTMANGLSVEVLNTDAEGRLILADALSHASKHYKPAAIVDVATLTGACALAVGDSAAGIFGNSPRLLKELQKAAEISGENVWPLPDFDDFFVELLTSEVADLRNIGKRREGGASTAALFLERFVNKDHPWVHLDIAGCGWYDSPRDMVSVRGPSGVPIRLLVEFLELYA